MIIMRLILSACVYAILLSNGYGQSSDTPDIYLVDVFHEDERIQYGPPKNITNLAGYDNQPVFTPDGERILFVSDRSGGQTDIYQYNIQSDTITRIYYTFPEKEYSPRVSPDDTIITALRENENETAHLWQMPFPGNTGKFELLIDEINLGYYTWVNDSTVALFALLKENGGLVSELYIKNLNTGELKYITKHIGRALYKIPKTNSFSYLKKTLDGQPSVFGWDIMEYNLDTDTINLLAPVLWRVEDYCWTPRKTIMMANGAKLMEAIPFYFYKYGWKEVADFSSYGIYNITRLAVSPKGNKLAFTGFLYEEAEMNGQ